MEKIKDKKMNNNPEGHAPGPGCIIPIEKKDEGSEKPKSTVGDEYKLSRSNDVSQHEEDDVEIPSRTTKISGKESRQDRADRKDREEHPQR